MNDISVGNFWLVVRVVQRSQRVLHPVLVVSVGQVIASMSSTRLLPVFGSEHGHFGLDHKIVKLHGLNQVSVPNLAPITDANVAHLLGHVVQGGASLLEVVLSAEHSSVLLHSLLHLEAQFRSGDGSLGISQRVKFGNRFLASVRRELFLGLAGRVIFSSGLSGSSSEDDKIEE